MTPSRDLVALVLAVGVAMAALALTIGIVVVHGTSVITPDEGEVLGAIVGALVGALASYIGSSKKPDDEL